MNTYMTASSTDKNKENNQTFLLTQSNTPPNNDDEVVETAATSELEITDKNSSTLVQQHSTRLLVQQSLVSLNAHNPHYGDKLGSKDTNSLRLIFQNINSLQPKSTLKWCSTIETITEIEADITGLVETSVNWTKRKLKQSFQQILSKNDIRTPQHELLEKLNVM